MSARDWQPGDVAMVRDKHTDSYVACFMDVDREWVVVGSGSPSGAWIRDVADIRPAVPPIDPEAPIPDEWVGVFVAARDAKGYSASRAGLAALFAHIATPREPKPDEPTGDRATVRDREGVLWTRHNDSGNANPWRNIVGLHCPWKALDVPGDGVLWGGVE